MNNATLSALRTALGYTQDEAAAFIGGCSQRSWAYWESGERPKIPYDVVERIAAMAEWRENALTAMLQAISDFEDTVPEGEHIEPTVLVWYKSIDDWATLNDRDAALYKPHRSVIAELVASHGCVAVDFDAPAYAKWLGGRSDSETMRGQWAIETFSKNDGNLP